MVQAHARRAAAAALAGAVLVACSSSPDTARPPVRGAPVHPPMAPGDERKGTTAPVDAGQDVPRELRFSADSLAGGTIRGADYAGHDLVMWFWAPW